MQVILLVITTNQYIHDSLIHYKYGPVGDKKALFQTRVVAIKSVKGKLKLSLENGHSQSS